MDDVKLETGGGCAPLSVFLKIKERPFMNTAITSMNGQILTGNSQRVNFSSVTNSSQNSVQGIQLVTATGAEVAQNLVRNLAEVKATAKEMQQISDMYGRKIQFNVNHELNNVVITVVDSSTNEVIREIPSADMQRLQARLKKTIGLLFDATA